MRIFGLTISRDKGDTANVAAGGTDASASTSVRTGVLLGSTAPAAASKAAVGQTDVPSSAVTTSGGFFISVLEKFSGAWQRNVVADGQEQLLAFSAVYSCVALIAEDIAKLRIKLTRMAPSGAWSDVWTDVDTGAPFLRALKKPNHYQTRSQFICQWITAKMLYGNAYVLKGRDDRGVVNALYVLDSRLVTPLVTTSGDVYYRINRDALSGVFKDSLTVPASEIIHDRTIALWHPLVGVSPIYACAASATQGVRIQNNSAKFFENMSRPSGHLTATGTIDDVTANRLKSEFETNFGAGNLGRLLVTGDGLKYEAMTISADDAQLIEQLRWTAEDVARAFRVPLHMINMGPPPGVNVGAVNQAYYTQTLQGLIESIELLLDEGLELPAYYGTEFDLESLLRMDTGSRYQSYSEAIGGGWMTPNEARARENLPPIAGGDTVYMQQQNYSLAALAKRDAKADPFSPPGGGGGPPALPAPASSGATDPNADPNATPSADANAAAATSKGIHVKSTHAHEFDFETHASSVLDAEIVE